MTDWRFCIAPMMDWTDRHCRFFLRLIAPHARLYTEMVTTGALIHGDRTRFLAHNPEEHPLALQLGGADPQALAQAARYGAEAGYDEINLNCGCPSDRVQNGAFGACLMRNPALVRDCVAAMQAVVDMPVTVKTRIGIDEQDSYAFTRDFIGTVAEGGVQVFIIHARKAWLKGLSPKENRDVPPLDYARVLRLKSDFPHLCFILNGGLNKVEDSAPWLHHLDGVMIGRAAYQNPWHLRDYEQRFFGAEKEGETDPRDEIVRAMADYAAREVQKGVPLKSITRHILGLFQHCPGARQWRRILSEQAYLPDATPDVILRAHEAILATPHSRAA